MGAFNYIEIIGRTLLSESLTLDVVQSDREVTLRFGLKDRYCSKTLTLSESQDESQVRLAWDQIFNIFAKEFTTGTVPAVIKNPKGGSMREDTVNAGVSAIQSAGESALKEQLGIAFDNGVQFQKENDLTTLTPEDAQKMVDDATASLKQKVSDLELELSQKDADALEEAMADELATLAQKLRDRTVKAAPVEAQPEEQAQ